MICKMDNLVFHNPKFLYLLVLIPVLIILNILNYRKRNVSLLISSLQPLKKLNKPFRLYLKHFNFAIKMAAFALIIIAFARPQVIDEWSTSNTEGVDIVLCIDVSGSMRAMDFKPNRLEASKAIAADFINSRTGDRFAVTVFSAESFTKSPLTSDRVMVINLLHEVDFGMMEDGTAIGTGLATAVNRIKDSKAVSKVIILLTDGVNNTGMIGPVTAAEIAAEYNIRVYTIGVGSIGEAPIQVQTPFGPRMQNMKVEIDEDVLREIASLTGGKYFRATDEKTLASVYQEIDRLEKTILDVEKFDHKKEKYFPFLLIGLLLMGFHTLLNLTLLRVIP